MDARFAVIGNPVQHSRSPQIHKCFAQACKIPLTYELIESTKENFFNDVQDFFNQGGQGLNVTAPFKALAFSLSELQTIRCKLAGTANTLWIENNKLNADNTDGIGFIRDISQYVDLNNKSFLLLGSGGAACGILAALTELDNVNLVVATRLIKITLAKQFSQVVFMQYEELANLPYHFNIIINTTPNIESDYLNCIKKYLSYHPFCYDICYQKKSKFLRAAEQSGCQTANGFGMLIEQAAESFYIWHRIYPTRVSVESVKLVL